MNRLTWCCKNDNPQPAIDKSNRTYRDAYPGVKQVDWAEKFQPLLSVDLLKTTSWAYNSIQRMYVCTYVCTEYVSIRRVAEFVLKCLQSSA